MFSKKVFFISIAVILSLALGTVLLFPMQLGKQILDSDALWVVHTIADIDEEGTPSMVTADYYFEEGSEELEELKMTLSKYSYHRSLSYFSGRTSIEGSPDGHMMDIYSRDSSISFTGTRKIIIGGDVYKLGYWNNKKAKSLVEDIRKILE